MLYGILASEEDLVFNYEENLKGHRSKIYKHILINRRETRRIYLTSL